ncbi:hypothetical protein AAII07_54385 [Microvirga sp. 0TCS3.31]|jgi:hypothetical protein
MNTDDVSSSGECIDPVIGMMNAPGAAGSAWRMTTEDRATAMSPFAIGGSNPEHVLSMTNRLQDELSLSNRQRQGPQRLEKRFSHNPAD